jgi:hypothetical protein
MVARADHVGQRRGQRADLHHEGVPSGPIVALQVIGSVSAWSKEERGEREKE